MTVRRVVVYLFELAVLITIGCLLEPGLAHAAKLRVTWLAPTTNTDGTPLTDLVGYRVEWGSCNADGSFGVYQAGLNVTDPTALGAWIYPTGLTRVCAHVFAINAQNVLSAASNTGSGPVPVKPSTPIH